tara:strand:+ start:537 stop:1334 length:798 start_codon:yes stop_codon:yes gene_type:complete
MNDLEIYCVTNKKLDFLEKSPFKLVGVGNESFSEKYIQCDHKENIYHKEKNYSELAFHYWYWKNILPKEKNQWIGFCQKRRFWLKSEINKNDISKENLNDFILTDIDGELKNFESFICKPINISGAKKIKIIKRGWKNLIKDPSIILNPKKETISFHFDMHHGHKNLERAIKLLDDENRDDFFSYVNTRNFYNPHIMCISKPEILERWFNNLFPWLERCENEFKNIELKGYDTERLYAYLAERYLSYWFKKYTKYKELPWAAIIL